MFQVQWDEPSSILRPERVSPWELEPLVANAPPTSQPTQRNKRSRPPVLPSPTPDISALGRRVFYIAILHASSDCWFWIKAPCFASGVWKSPVEAPSAFSYCESQRGRDFYPSSNFNSATKGNSFGFSGNNSVTAVSSNSMYWSNRVEAVTESFSPVANKESGEKRQGTGNGCRLFGIQLLDNSNMEETSPVVTMSRTPGDELPVQYLDAESDRNSEPNRSDVPSVSCDAEKSCLRSPQESQSRQIRSCTKVVWLLFFFFFL